MTGLDIFLCNVASLKRRKYELELLLEDTRPDVVFIQETNTKKSPEITGYIMLDYIPAGLKTRGCAAFVREKGKFQRLEVEHNTAGMETLGLEAKSNGRTSLRIIGAYNSPANKLPLDRLLDQLNVGTPTIIIGDLNAKCNIPLHQTTNRNGDILDEAMEKGEIIVVSPDDYTRYDHSNRNPSVLDLALTTTRHMAIISSLNVLPDIGSDHRPILLHINHSIKSSPNIRKPRFDKADWIGYRKYIVNRMVASPQISHNQQSIDAGVAFLTEVIQKSDAENVPRSKLSSKPELKPKPPHIVKLIKEKQELRKRMRRLKEYQLKPRINWLDKQIKRAILEYDADSARRQWDATANKSKSGFYKLAKRFLCPAQNTDNSFPLKDESGKKITDTRQKIEMFTGYYTEIFAAHENDTTNPHENAAYVYTAEIKEKYSEVCKRHWPVEVDTTVTRGRLLKILSNVKNTSPGQDGIYYGHIKDLPADTLDYLAHLYQTCIETCYFPRAWKQGRVTLIPKPGKDHTTAKGYRPITLLPALAKVLERLINETVGKYTEDHGKLPETQAAYRKNRGAQDQLYRLTEDATRSITNNMVTMATCFDAEKAFDRLWQEGFALKLKHANFPEVMIALLTNYLSDRRIQLRINGKLSDTIDLRTGTPQGSCLSGLIWGLWLCDIPQPDQEKDVNLSQYADDIASWCNAKDHVTARQHLQEYNSTLEQWCTDWKLKLAADKTQLTAFTTKKKLRRNLVSQNIGKTQVSHSDTITFLGVTFDYNMTWLSYSTALKKRLKQRTKTFAGITGSRRYPRADSETSLKILKTMIEPLVYYAPSATCARPDRFFVEQDKLLQQAARLALHLPCTITKNYVIKKSGLQNSKEKTLKLAQNYIYSEKRSAYVKQLAQRPPTRKALDIKTKMKTPNVVMKTW